MKSHFSYVFLFLLISCEIMCREEKDTFLKAFRNDFIDYCSNDMIKSKSKSCNHLSVGTCGDSMMFTGVEEDGSLCFMTEYRTKEPGKKSEGTKIIENEEGYVIATEGGLNSIILFDKSFKFVWMKEFFFNQSSIHGSAVSIVSILLFENETTLILANFKRVGYVGEEGALILINSVGRVIWVHSFKNDNKTLAVHFDDFVFCGDQYVCVGGKSQIDTDEGGGDLIIAKFKITEVKPELIFSYLYTSNVHEKQDVDVGKIGYFNNSIYICGSVNLVALEDWVYFIFKIDLDDVESITGNLISRSSVTLSSGCSSLFISEKSQIVKTAGHFQDYGPVLIDMPFASFDNLDSENQKYTDVIVNYIKLFGDQTYSGFNSFVGIYDDEKEEISSFLASGTIMSSDQTVNELFVMKTDVTGLPCNPIEGQGISSISALLYFNPHVLIEGNLSSYFLSKKIINVDDIFNVVNLLSKNGSDNHERDFCWSCQGKYMNDPDVCNNHGTCDLMNLCSCYPGWDIDNTCSGIGCFGVSKNSKDVCSGHGTCKSPDDCDCQFGYTSRDDCDIFEMPIWLPVLIVVVIISFLVFICICGFLLLCFFFIFICFSISFICCFFSEVYKKRVKRNISRSYKKLIINEDEENSEFVRSAKIRINLDLFKIDYNKEIRLERVIDMNSSSGTGLYLATWLGAGKRKVCFKKFKTKQLFQSQQYFEDFEKEISIIGSISHPHIVSVFGATLSPICGIVMEYCENGDIKKFLSGRKYPLHEKIRFLLEITTAMEFIHSRKMIHRDLKCENCLVDSSEKIKISDFGISKFFYDEKSTRTRNIGTSVYMAPELTSTTPYGNKIDVFSFGIMIYCIISGKFSPYGESETFVELKVAKDPNFRPNVKDMEMILDDDTSFLVEMAKECWDHDPKNRKSFTDLFVVFELYFASLK